jgi:nuclear pore complex protein Nup160
MSESQRLLVATQLSSLFPSSQITSISLRTTRRKTPLPPTPNDSDPPAEHALYSSVLHTQSTGTIVLRILHGGLVLELISLTTNISPIRFVFPASVLPSPALFVWQGSELHILAVTSMGSVYRLVLPLGSNQDLWQDLAGANWCREYLIKGVAGPMRGLVQVQGPHCVVIGLPNGSIMRIETEFLGDESRDGTFTTFLWRNVYVNRLPNCR